MGHVSGRHTKVHNCLRIGPSWTYVRKQIYNMILVPNDVLEKWCGMNIAKRAVTAVFFYSVNWIKRCMLANIVVYFMIIVKNIFIYSRRMKKIQDMGKIFSWSGGRPFKVIDKRS